jgi:3-dehydroquinate synthase
MVLGADLSCRLKRISKADVERLTKIIHSMNLPIIPPKFGVKRYMELMQVDKKTEGGQIRYVILEKIGRAQIESAPDALVKETLSATGAA